MILLSGTERRIMQEKIKTIRAPLMISACSIPVDLVSANEFFFTSSEVMTLIFMQPVLIVYYLTYFEIKLRNK
jgi:hypothetical protein